MDFCQVFSCMLLLISTFAAEEQQQTLNFPFYGHNPENPEQRNLLALESLSVQKNKDARLAYQTTQNRSEYEGYENNYQLYYVPLYETKRQPELQDGRRKLDSAVDVNQRNELFYQQQQHLLNPYQQVPGYEQGQPHYLPQAQYYATTQQQTQEEHQAKQDTQQYQVPHQVYPQQSESQEHQRQQLQQQQQLQHQFYAQPNQPETAHQPPQQQQSEQYLYPQQQAYSHPQQNAYQLQQQQQQQLNLFNTAPNVFPTEAYQIVNNYQQVPQQLFYPHHPQQYSGHLGHAQPFVYSQSLAYPQQQAHLQPHPLPLPHPHSLPHPHLLSHPHSQPYLQPSTHQQQQIHAYQPPHPSTVRHFDAPFRPSQFAGYSRDPPTAPVHSATHSRRDAEQQTWQPITTGQHYHRYVKPIHENPREGAPNVGASGNDAAKTAENAAKYVYMSPQNIYALFKSRRTRTY